MVEKSLSAKSVSVMPIMLMGFVHVVATPFEGFFN